MVVRATYSPLSVHSQIYYVVLKRVEKLEVDEAQWQKDYSKIYRQPCVYSVEFVRQRKEAIEGMT